MWPVEYIRAVKDQIRWMLTRSVRKESSYVGSTPAPDEIGAFVMYTPDWRVVWLPDDQRGVGYCSDLGDHFACAPDPGVYALPNKVQKGEAMEFRFIGLPADNEAFVDLLYELCVDRLEMSPEECRRSCATVESMSPFLYDVNRGPEQLEERSRAPLVGKIVGARRA